MRRVDNEPFTSIEIVKKLKVSDRDTISIISAGPGIRNLDFKSLKQTDIMTLNDSIFHIPIKVHYHVFNEPPSNPKEKERYERLKKRFYVHKFSTFKYQNWHRIMPLEDSRASLAFILSIEIALMMEYKHLNLYGYDFSCKDGYIHWWDKEPFKDKEEIKKKEEFLVKQEKIYTDYIDNLLSIRKDIFISRKNYG